MSNVIISIVEATGLGVFIYYLFRGLSAKITSLEGVVSAQKQTIDVMDKRIEETEKIGGIYRNLITNLPEDIDNYKTIISKTKDDVILELTKQKEDTEKKLRSATIQLEKSGKPEEEMKLHLSILKNLLSRPSNNVIHDKNEYDIKSICQFNERSLEDSVQKLAKSKTLDEFIRELGFELTITEDNDVFKLVFSNERKTPSGEPIEAAIGNTHIDGGWHVVVNNSIWMNQLRLTELKDEFSAIKTIT